MPYTTELTEDYLGVVHHASGLLTGQEILEGSRVVTQLVQNTENFHFEFLDLTAVTSVQVSPEEMEQIAQLDYFAAFFRPEATVVVAAPNDELFELGRKWEKMVENLGWKTHVTRDCAEGWRWLQENFVSPTPETQPQEKIS